MIEYSSVQAMVEETTLRKTRAMADSIRRNNEALERYLGWLEAEYEAWQKLPWYRKIPGYLRRTWRRTDRYLYTLWLALKGVELVEIED
jgi:hypothetical protein